VQPADPRTGATPSRIDPHHGRHLPTMSESRFRAVKAYENESFLQSPDARALRILAEYLEPQTRFDRAHFKTFGPSSLDFEVVYFITAPEYHLYMDIQQRINFEILRQLGGLRVDFAYPTQTIYAHTAGAPQPPARRAAG